MKRRTAHRGFTLIELMIVVAIIGILAAIAIPNFIKFQARAKTSEAKGQLKGLYTAQKSYYQEHDTYHSSVTMIGFDPERGNRYAFYNGASTGCRDRSGLQQDRQPTDFCVEVDTFKHPDSPSKLPTPSLGTIAYSTAGGTNPAAPPSVVPGGTGNFAAVAVGNVDSETTGLDTWFISSKDATITPSSTCTSSSIRAPAGSPVSTLNDVECDG